MALPSDWHPIEATVFEDLTDGIPAIMDNVYVQDLYHDAMWNLDIPIRERDAAHNELVEFIHDQYEIEFDQEFDWEAWREWYDAQ